HIGDGKIVRIDEQFRRLNLPDGLHLAQRAEDGRRAGLVLQDRHGFLADSVQQADLAPDTAEIEVERGRDLLLGDAALDRLADHLVLLDRRETADLPVVGERLVVGGDEAFYLLSTGVLQRLDPQVTVEQQPGGRLVVVPHNNRRLYDTDLGDGGHD